MAYAFIAILLLFVTVLCKKSDWKSKDIAHDYGYMEYLENSYENYENERLIAYNDYLSNYFVDILEDTLNYLYSDPNELVLYDTYYNPRRYRSENAQESIHYASKSDFDVADYIDYSYYMMNDDNIEPYHVGDTVKIVGWKLKYDNKVAEVVGPYQHYHKRYPVRIKFTGGSGPLADTVNVPEKHLQPVMVRPPPVKVPKFKIGDIVQLIDMPHSVGYNKKFAKIMGKEHNGQYSVMIKQMDDHFKKGVEQIVDVDAVKLKLKDYIHVPTVKLKAKPLLTIDEERYCTATGQFCLGIPRPVANPYEENLKDLKEELKAFKKERKVKKPYNFIKIDAKWNKYKTVKDPLQLTQSEYYVLYLYMVDTDFCTDFRKYYYNDDVPYKNVYHIHNTFWKAMHKDGRLNELYDKKSVAILPYLYHGSSSSLEKLMIDITAARKELKEMNNLRKKILAGGFSQDVRKELQKEMDQKQKDTSMFVHGPLSTSVMKDVAANFAKEQPNILAISKKELTKQLDRYGHWKEMIGYIPRATMEAIGGYDTEYEVLIGDFSAAILRITSKFG